MLSLDKFERYPLTFGPTPIEYLPRMTEALGGRVEIYAKRDDCNSGLAMGGNKLRKLEYIVPDAIASNADTLVSIGGIQSNHTRMVAGTAAKIGMKCVVVQESWVSHEDAVYDRVGNILLTRLMGANSRIVPDGFDIGIRKSWEDAIQSVKDAGGKPYGIPAGASVHKYGGLGYVGFAEEVRAQERQMGITFDYIDYTAGGKALGEQLGKCIKTFTGAGVVINGGVDTSNIPRRGGRVIVQSLDDVTLGGFSGSVMKSNHLGFGFTIAVNNVNRENYAIIGDQKGNAAERSRHYGDFSHVTPPALQGRRWAAFT